MSQINCSLLLRYVSGSACLSIAKVPLSSMIALSALFGFVLQEQKIGLDSLSCFGVVFLLATGCATLNNIQDTALDTHLSRTHKRPLPSGGITKSMASLQAVLLLGAGLLGLSILSKDGSPLPLYGGIVSIILYNGIYTPLKPTMVLAIIPGAICGMIAPLLGFFLAGGTSPSLAVITVMGIIGLWQLPHFWLILLSYRKDYRHNDCPTMLTLLSERQLRRVILSWVLSFALVTLFLPFLGVITSPIGTAIIFLNAFFLSAYFAFRCLQNTPLSTKSSQQLFHHLNFSLLLVMLLGIVAR